MVSYEYAKAMYELAIEEGKEALFNEDFDAFNELIKDKDFFDVLDAPNIEVSKKKDIIRKSLKGFDETFIHFIDVLLDRNRISIYSEIFGEYNRLILNKNDVMKISVYSAEALSNIDMIHLTKSLQNKYVGKKIEIENIIKPELIGGIQIESNGESLDMSLKNSLNLLKESL